MKRIVADLQQTETPFAAAERYSTVKTLTLSRIPIFHNPDLQLSSVPPVVITTINRKAPRELVVSPFNEKAKRNHSPLPIRNCSCHKDPNQGQRKRKEFNDVLSCTWVTLLIFWRSPATRKYIVTSLMAHNTILEVGTPPWPYGSAFREGVGASDIDLAACFHDQLI